MGQYHSRSDVHSKVVCWAIVFDLLQHSRVLRDHAEAGLIVFGINHEMRDFKAQRKKNLDLVIARPGTTDPTSKKTPRSFSELGEHFDVRLSDDQAGRLAALPVAHEGPVGSVLLALEAKACMTAHVRALPRLYDELNSSQLTVHGSSDQAVAAGLAMVNISDSFLSPDLNPLGLKQRSRVVSQHRQPDDAIRTVTKLRELPRRTRPGEEGFDALSILIVECKNDGTPVTIVSSAPAPALNDDYHYEQMVRRTASQYEFRFPKL